MALANYSDLRAAIGDWLERDDLGDYLDDFITLTNALIKRAPRSPQEGGVGGVRANLTRTTDTMSDDTLTLPSDFMELDVFYYVRGGQRVHPQAIGDDAMGTWRRSGTGAPSYFVINDSIELDVTPDSAYSYTLIYWPSFSLSSTNTTNWLLTNFPDVYLHGCLYNAARFVRNDKEAAARLDEYRDAAWAASSTYKLGRKTRGSVVAMPPQIVSDGRY